MTVEELLFARLAADSAVQVLLGSPPAIYPDIVPEGAALPHARYSRIATERPKAMKESPGLSTASFQIDVWADTSGAAKAIIDAIRLALDYWIDRDAGIHGALVDGENSDFEEDRLEFRRMLTVDVHSQGIDA